jgi:hypothetical protein
MESTIVLLWKLNILKYFFHVYVINLIVSICVGYVFGILYHAFTQFGENIILLFLVFHFMKWKDTNNTRWKFSLHYVKSNNSKNKK